MAPRTISTATISFGLVSIPVRLYSTSEPGSSVSFHMLHTCGSRLRQQYQCPQCDRVVPREEIVKGYEVARGQHVVLSEEELESAEAEASKSIDIQAFVPAEAIDPLLYDRAYYLGPDKGAEKSYRLLAQAMRATGRVAIARYAARGKQYIVAVRPHEDGLLLQQLRYADEVKSFSEVETGSAKVSPAELDLAKKLIDQIATDTFHPEAYEDEVAKRLRAMIEAKVEGEEIEIAPAEEPRAQIIDLMEALRASLAAESADAAAAGRKGPQRSEGAKGAARKPTRARRKASKK